MITTISLFFLFLLLGVPISFVILAASGIGIWEAGSNLVILAQQMFAGMNNYTMLAVPFFIISGDIAAKGDTSQRLIDVINAFMGRLRGGLGIATIITCVFFGAITESSMATVVAVGGLMLPKLLERKYPRSLSLGIIASAGTIGVMIPPSVPMVMICLAMGTSVGEQFTAGFVPGFLLAGAFCVYTWSFAKKNNIPLEPKVSWGEKFKILKKSFFSLMFPVIVLGGIYSGLTTPTEAAVVSVFYVMLVELFINRSLTLREMYKIVSKSVVDAAALTMTIATAQVFVWYMTTEKIPEMLYNFLISNVSSGFILLILLAVLFLIVGCFTNVVTVVIILGPILLGALNYFGVDLIHFGIIAVLMSQIVFLTPPFGLCLFVTMKTARSSMAEVVKAAMPFLIIMLLMCILFILVPQISTFLPDLIYGG